MAKLIISILFLLSFGASSMVFANYDRDAKTFLFQGKMRAKEILDAASRNPEIPIRFLPLLKKMQWKLDLLGLEFPPERRDFPSCRGNNYGFAVYGEDPWDRRIIENTIFICRTVINRRHDSNGLNFLTEVILHEAAHVASQSADECNASIMEVSAMLYAGHAVAIDDQRYFRRCGIDPTTPPH